MEAPFEQLDFVYTPCEDVAAEVARLSTSLGAEVEFAIERFGTRVAMVRLAELPPHLVLAEHLSPGPPIMVYRVADLDRVVAELSAAGVDAGPRLGFPYGPIHSFSLDSGHRLAVYERTRPEVEEALAGRRDF